MLRLALLLFFALLPLPALAHLGETHTIIVRVNESGYEPSNITILAGDIIVFENTGTEPHWPASNIHPTHALYPGSDIRKCGTDKASVIFDACRGLEPGESYSFTFRQPGTWKYHDHLFPSLGGEIIVEGDGTAGEYDTEETPGIFARVFESIRVLGARAKYNLSPALLTKDLKAVNMWRVAFDDARLRFWMRVLGPDTTLDELQKDSYLGELDGAPIYQCHIPAHYLGRMAYELFDTQAFLGEIDSRCEFGFYHGTLEKSLAKYDDPVEFLSSVCAKSDDPIVRGFCKHGMGHGFVVLDNYDLPAALAQCQALEDSTSRQLCYHGAFMENAFASPEVATAVAHNTPWVDPDDPDFPCNYLETRMKDAEITRQCYFGQTFLWGAPISPAFNTDNVIERCKQAPEEAQLMCYAGLGFSAGAAGVFFSNEKLIDTCNNTPTHETRNYCFAGVYFMRDNVWPEKQKFDESVFCSLVNKQRGMKCDQYYDELLPWASPRNT